MTTLSSLYSAIAKSMLGRYAVYAINLLSMMILARVFSPEIFGTVAAIMVFFVFFQIMAEAGLGPAIINLHSLLPDDRDGLFGLTILLGFLLTASFASLGSVFLEFYKLPRVDEVVPFVAASILFYSASIVPNAILLREQAFFRIANSAALAELISTAAAIFLSYFTDPLIALASKGALSAATLFVMLWYHSGRSDFGRPWPGYKFSAIKPLMSFSGYQFGFNLINYFSRNLDNILVGKYMGAGTLGVYDKAYQLMKYPLMLLTFAMTPAIQPVIRMYSGDRDKVEKIHSDFAFKLSIVGAVAGLLLFIFSDRIVAIVLGSQWSYVAPIIKILSVAVPVQVVLSTSGSFFQAMDKASLLFVSGTLSAIVMVGAIVVGIVARDIELLCWCLVAAFHINFFQAYYYLYRKVFVCPFRRFLMRMSPAAIVVFGMVWYAHVT